MNEIKGIVPQMFDELTLVLYGRIRYSCVNLNFIIMHIIYIEVFEIEKVVCTCSVFKTVFAAYLHKTVKRVEI